MLGFINEFVYTNYYAVIGIFIFLFITHRVLTSVWAEKRFDQSGYNPKGHTWRSIECNKSIPFNNLCCICGKMMLPTVGLYCECCGLSGCKTCIKYVSKLSRCKVIFLPDSETLHHIWVKVNNHLGDSQELLNDKDRDEYFCSWCQRLQRLTASEARNSQECDFGSMKNVIVPPQCVTVHKGKINIKPVDDENWNPVFILANKKSGSNKGGELLSQFRGLLNPIQVVDLGHTSPESVVRWLPKKCRILVGGGDGSVSWVLNALHDSKVKAAVGIVPLGTGNDLSRVMGWGPSADDIDAHQLLSLVDKAVEQPLDRWKITIRRSGGRLRRGAERVVYAHNYATIGVDAQVTLDFHNARNNYLNVCASRYINYVAYVVFGVGRALDDGCCDGLERRMRVRVAPPERSLALPPIQSLVMLNIPSWAAGLDLWNLGSNEGIGEQSLDDGLIEVAGISSSFHMAQLHCKISEPLKFAQASKVEVELRGSCAMQVDGEPWMQPPASISIEHGGCSTLLRNCLPCDGSTSSANG